MRNYKIEREMYRIAVELIESAILPAGAVPESSTPQPTTTTRVFSSTAPMQVPPSVSKRAQCLMRLSSTRRSHTVCASFAKTKIHPIKCCLPAEFAKSD